MSRTVRVGKKLSLHKESLRRLSPIEMGGIVGGSGLAMRRDAGLGTHAGLLCNNLDGWDANASLNVSVCPVLPPELDPHGGGPNGAP